MPRGRHLFVSDLHLDCAAPAAVALFLQFLATEGRTASALYILGDLFESWIGDDDDDPARRSVCEALRALTQAGIACRVLHGNRDFLLGRGFAARTGCELLPDPSVLQLGARRIVISHGDALCTRDVAYQRFRRVVRQRPVQRGWLALPLGTRRALAARIRQRSTQHMRRKAGDIMDVTPDAVSALLQSSGADWLVHGHTHRPGVHQLVVDGRNCLRIVLGDWYEQGSLLILQENAAPELRVLSAAATGADGQV